MSVTRHYLPWYREGFATVLTGVPAGGHGRAALPADMRLSGSATRTGLPVELSGPGDVVGLDPREVTRCEPFDGCPNFEPAYFPYVELASPDLPWRFSPTGPTEMTLPDPEHAGTDMTGTRLQPWLALVVIPADQATLAPAGPGGLPVLTTPADQLPPPGQSWAWAHVQVTTSGESLDAALADPSRRVTRILCARRLAGATRYGAYLVPTFAAGKAVLGSGEVGANPLESAWPASGTVRLPVYYQWSFATSGDGSFETLARRLRPRRPPTAASGRNINTDAPGWDADRHAGRTTVMQGALRPLQSAELPADPDLAESLRGAVSTDVVGVKLLPPLYGQDYQHGVTAIGHGATGWLAELNTDPRRRLAAGLAAWAVVVEQEDLADEAWQQLARAGLPSKSSAALDLAGVIIATLGSRQQPRSPVAPAALRAARPRGPFAGVVTALQLATASWPVLRPRPVDPGLVPVTHAITDGLQQPAPTAAFAPTYAQPAYELLRALAPDWLLPGAEQIGLDSVVLLQSNAAFVEAFMVGLNHSLAQELIWRGYPLDRSATMFSEFWGLAGATGQEGARIANWSPGSELGSHLSGADELVLLIRGPFVSRFPTAVIYLSRTASDQSEQRLMPNLNGRIGLDCAFVGFPLSKAAAEAPPTDGGGPWRVVLEESVNHARFGVDDAPENGTSPLTSWQDLDWGHPQLSGHSHVPVQEDGPLRGLTRPTAAGAVDTATWGLSSGHLASALQQPAFRVRVPIALWLTAETEA